MDSTTKEPSKFSTKNWLEIDGGGQKLYNRASQIKFKTIVLKSNLCDLNAATILIKGNMANRKVQADREHKQMTQADRKLKKLIFNCTFLLAAYVK